MCAQREPGSPAYKHRAALLLQGAGDVLADLAAQESAQGQLRGGGVFGQGGFGTAQGAGQLGDSGGVTFDRIAPCLLPEQRLVSAVRLTGPRYWHQLLERRGAGRGRGHGPSLAALYSTRTLFVQRKAGALPYADDPSGGTPACPPARLPVGCCSNHLPCGRVSSLHRLLAAPN